MLMTKLGIIAQMVRDNAEFDGASDYLSLADSDDWDFGDDMTIELIFKSSQTTAVSTMLCREWGSSPYTGAWAILNNGDGVGDALTIYWGAYSTSSSFMVSSDNTYRDGEFHHFAWTKDSNVHKMWLDGAQVATITDATAFAPASKILTIGGDTTFNRWFDGNLKGVRITKGTARYSATFTPPSEFENDTNTVLCMNFKEDVGATTFIDDTGKTVTTYGNVVIVEG